MTSYLCAGGRRRLARVLLFLPLLGACAGDAAVPGGLRGRLLGAPIARPDFTLPDANGTPYAFAERTAGKLTFLFFGYTYCPDICPVHLSTLAAALAELPYAARQQVEMVFVTVDPERDTPERLREWLGAFDARFVGLRGTLEEANAAAAQVGFPPSSREPGESENYSVAHPASILAFAPEGPAYVAYPFGTRREDWVHDLPLLLELDSAAFERLTPTPAGSGVRTGAPRPDDAVTITPDAGVQVTRAFVTRSRMAGAAALYALLENRTDRPDALVAVDAPARRVELHETVREGEGTAQRMQMRPVPEIAIPALGQARLEPGGYHVMLIEPALDWQPGDTARVRFRFRGGTVRTVHAPVVLPADVVRLLEGG